MTGPGVTGIPDDRYRSTMEVVVISGRHNGALEKTFGASRGIAKPIQKSHKNS